MGCVPSSKSSSTFNDAYLKGETSSTIDRETPNKVNSVLRTTHRVSKIFQKYQSKMLVIYEIPAENLISI